MLETKIKFNWRIVGNELVTDFLAKSIQNNKVFGTYIISGPLGVGKQKLALNLASILYCADTSHKPCGICPNCLQFEKFYLRDISENNISDFHYLARVSDKKNISVEQVRNLIARLNMSSFGQRHKIAIIENAQNLSIEAANALLKTLEEPKKDVIVILLVNDKDNLPATIASRSQILNMKLLATDKIYEYLADTLAINRPLAKDIAHLAMGRAEIAINLSEDTDKYNNYKALSQIVADFFKTSINDRFRELDSLISSRLANPEARAIAKQFLNMWQGIIRDMMLYQLGQNNLIEHQYLLTTYGELQTRINLDKLIKLNQLIERAYEQIGANVNPKLVLENVSLEV